MKKPLVTIVGATCAGKTSVAIQVAQALDLEIVSADSRQIYRRLDAGTAKPTRQEREAVPHHLLDCADPQESYTAARFGDEAQAAMESVESRRKMPLLVGGSGLYLRAAEEGIFEGPTAQPALRDEFRAFSKRNGRAALHARLSEVDPETAARLHESDEIRIIRALEVFEVTGEPISVHHRRHKERGPIRRSMRFGLQWPTIWLDRRIRERVRSMLGKPWIQEVRELLDSGLSPDAPALHALGYPEVCKHVLGELPEAELEPAISLATRRFAKRQRTWFRKLDDVRWFRVGSQEDLNAAGEEIVAEVRRRLSGPSA